MSAAKDVIPGRLRGFLDDIQAPFTENGGKDRGLSIMVVYHYTKMLHLEKIISAGVINLEPELYGYARGVKVPIGGTRFVWLTAEQYVPNTVRPIHGGDDTSTTTRYLEDWDGEPMEFYRFIFNSSDPRIVPWSAREKKSQGSKQRAALRVSAKDQGDSMKKWFVSEEPLEIGEYEKANLKPDARNFYVSTWDKR